jgi:hypothetical protein
LRHSLRPSNRHLRSGRRFPARGLRAGLVEPSAGPSPRKAMSLSEGPRAARGSI